MREGRDLVGVIFDLDIPLFGSLGEVERFEDEASIRDGAGIRASQSIDLLDSSIQRCLHRHSLRKRRHRRA